MESAQSWRAGSKTLTVYSGGEPAEVATYRFGKLIRRFGGSGHIGDHGRYLMLAEYGSLKIPEQKSSMSSARAGREARTSQRPEVQKHFGAGENIAPDPEHLRAQPRSRRRSFEQVPYLFRPSVDVPAVDVVVSRKLPAEHISIHESRLECDCSS
jgi:hypothetical protein